MGQILRTTSSTGRPHRGSKASGVTMSFLARLMTPATRSIGVWVSESPSFLAARFMSDPASSGSRME